MDGRKSGEEPGKVEAWLKALGLEQHARAFAEHGVEFETLPDLTKEDLGELKVTRLGERKKIMKAASELTEAQKSSDPKLMTAPKPLVIVSFIVFVFAIGITVHLVFFPGKNAELPEQTIYWFAIAVVAAVLPWVKQFKWKDIEFKLADIENKIEWVANRRYANLIYLIDDSDNLAVVYHKQYKRWIPCGSRLEPYEMPHLAVHRAVKNELGLDESRYRFWPDHQTEIYGDTEIVPRPFQVQLEKGDHREGIPFHYDFVYICRINGVKPTLGGTEISRWISIEELKKEIEEAGPDGKATFPDVIPTFHKILQALHHSQNSSV